MKQVLTTVVMYPFVVVAVWFAWHATGVVAHGGSGGEWHWVIWLLSIPLTILCERINDLFRIK